MLDFNEKLREQGVDKKVTVQKVCRICRDEKQVREILNEIWNQPAKKQGTVSEALNRNQNVLEFEKALVVDSVNTAYKEQIQPVRRFTCSNSTSTRILRELEY